MSVSYDKANRKDATERGRVLASVEVAGLTFQGGVTPAEQGEIIALYTKLNARKVAEAGQPAPKSPNPPGQPG